MKRSILLLLAWLTAFPAAAQDPVIPGGVFTAGTTALDDRGRAWAYLRVIPADAASLQDRALAVYLRTGPPDAAGEFVLQGAFQPATNPPLASAYVDRAVQLGGDRAQIEAAFRALYRQARYPDYLARLRVPRNPDDPPWPGDPPQPGEPGTAEQIAMVIARAARDSELAETLAVASAGSPAVAMATGHAWAGLLPVAEGQPVTLEVRLREGGADTGVVGRVALVAGEPLPLPPPGAPVQVPDPSPTGDRNVHLRWATPVELRRYALLSTGYNLYRVDKLIADSGGPQDTEELMALLQAEPDRVRRLNQGALLPPALFSEEDVDPVAGPDKETVFYTDDNNRFERDVTGQIIGVPFPDCAEYAYYVTARDLLGRDGLLSPRGDAQVVRRMAPQVPTGIRARAEIVPADGANPERYQVEVRWTPSADNGTPVTAYEILRGISGARTAGGETFLPDEKLNLGANLEKDDPALLIPCGVLDPASPLVDGSHVWLDTSPVNAPGGTREGSTVWYAVRAVYSSSCSRVLSAPGPPAFASFRPVKGPPAPSPQLCAQGYNPPLAILSAGAVGEAPVSHPASENRIRVVCRRTNAGVTHATFLVYVPVLASPILVGQSTVVFPAESGDGNDEVIADFTVGAVGLRLEGFPPAPVPTAEVLVACVAGTNAGITSSSSLVNTTFLPAPSGGGERPTCRQVTFVAAAASLGSPPEGSLRQSMLSTAHAAGGFTPAAGNYVFASIPGVADGTPVFLQARYGGGGPLVDAGGAVVRGGQVLLSPLEGIPATDCVAWSLRVPIPPAAACLHVRGRSDGSTEPVRIALCAPADAREYRFYRQIGGGELSLIASGEVPAGGGEVICEDSSLPLTSARLQYSGQFVDRFGNAGPLVPLGECPLGVVVPPPVPVLQQPVAILDESGQPAMKLEWFCPPPGVERFEVFLEKQRAALQRDWLIGLPLLTVAGPGGSGSTLSSRLTANLQASPAIFKLRSSREPGPPAENPAQTSFYTGRVDGDLGEGPQFSADASVERNVAYRVWIRAIGPDGGFSGPSKAWDFTWRTPKAPPGPGVEPKVDWPARPLPDAYTGDAYTPAVAVNQQTFWNYDFYPEGNAPTFIWPQAPRAQVDRNDPPPVTLYQRGVLIGSVPVSNSSFAAYIGPRELTDTDPHQAVFYSLAGLRGRNDPNLHLATKNGSPGETILPAALYRRQIPSEEFPDITGDVIQVSPLVQRIACQVIPGVVLMRDPFIGLEVVGTRRVEWERIYDPAPNPNGYYTIGDLQSITEANRVLIYLLDTQPVIEGARYEYFVVRFDRETMEIRETIHAGTTSIGPLPPPPVMPAKPPPNRPPPGPR